MPVKILPLLTERPSMTLAKKTLSLALSSLRDGNRRLAASRAVTAVIRAVRAARTKKLKAEATVILMEARTLLQNVAMKRTRRTR